MLGKVTNMMPSGENAMNRKGPIDCGVNMDTRNPSGSLSKKPVTPSAPGVAVGVGARVGAGVSVAVGAGAEVATEPSSELAVAEEVGLSSCVAAGWEAVVASATGVEGATG